MSRSVALAIALVGCVPRFALTSGAVLSCATSADCPSGMGCQPNLDVCVAASAIDVTPPRLVSATAVDSQHVEVTFDEAMQAATLGQATAYQLAPALQVNGAIISPDLRSALLVTSPQAPMVTYTLTVSGVTDQAGNAIDDQANTAQLTGFGAADPSAPELLAPPTDAVERLSSVSLAWAPRLGAESYTVQIATDPQFSMNLVSVTVAETNVTLPDAANNVAALTQAVTYYWRVRADVTGAPFDDSYPWSQFDALGDSVYVYCPESMMVCSDGGQTGSISHPLRTIGGGVGLASSLGIATVRVAGRGGTIAYNESIKMIEGISLLGGYDPLFAATGPSTAAWIDNGDDAIVSASNFARGLPTTFDSFTVVSTSGSPTVAYGFYVSNVALLTISNNTITAHAATFQSDGVYIGASGSSGAGQGISLVGNVISAGNASNWDGAYSIGVEITGSTVTLQGNTITGGHVQTQGPGGVYQSVGVKATASSLAVDRNTMVGTSVVNASATTVARESLGLSLDTSSAAVTNNVMGTRDGGRSAAFRLSSAASGAVTLYNNTLVVGTVDNDGSTPMSSAYAIDTVQSLIAADNLAFAVPTAPGGTGFSAYYAETAQAAPSGFQDNTAAGFGCFYRQAAACQGPSGTNTAYANAGLLGLSSVTGVPLLTSATPVEVQFGGEDTGVTEDRNGAPRTCSTPVTACFSRGAYEY